MDRRPSEGEQALDQRFLEHLQEMVKVEDMSPKSKVIAHYLMVRAIRKGWIKKDDVLGEVKAHLEAAGEELKKAQAVFTSDVMDEFVRFLGEKIEKEWAEFRQQEQEANGGGIKQESIES